MANLSVKMAGVEFKNPVIPASGAYGFGQNYNSLYNIDILGGISLKGMTLQAKMGNEPCRIAETKCGILNSVGLQNPGVKYFIDNELPNLQDSNTVLIANVAGSTIKDCADIAQMLDETIVDMIELNISCPNVKEGGVAFGVDKIMAGNITKAVKSATKKPVMVKLSPNVTDISEIAKSVEYYGADAISLINTVLGMKININTRRPVLKNNVGGLSGGCIFPIAVRMVWEVANAVKLPICGMGGISSYEDVIEMMLAGASTIQIGTHLFSNPKAPIEIISGLNNWLDKNGITDINDIVGQVKQW